MPLLQPSLLPSLSRADDGDYTRLLDYARVSIICETFLQLKELLAILGA